MAQDIAPRPEGQSCSGKANEVVELKEALFFAAFLAIVLMPFILAGMKRKKK
jgi:hypothetical protein